MTDQIPAFNYLKPVTKLMKQTLPGSARCHGKDQEPEAAVCKLSLDFEMSLFVRGWSSADTACSKSLWNLFPGGFQDLARQIHSPSALKNGPDQMTSRSSF